MDIQPHAVPAPPSLAGNMQEEQSNVPYKERTFTPQETDIEPPLTAYEQLKGEPYTVRYFGLTDWLVAIKNPQFDVSGLQDKVNQVEQFIIREVQRKQLIDSPESYRAIMNELRTKLHIHPLE